MIKKSSQGLLRFERFNDIDRAYLNRDYQIHTSWTDGKNAPIEIIQAAQQMGLAGIAFTEHIRKESDYFPHFFALFSPRNHLPRG